MSFYPISYIAPNYRDYEGWWIKAYQGGTTTPIPIYTDSEGGGAAAKLQINSDGFIVSSGGLVVNPYVEEAYSLYMFPTAQEADNNDTGEAIRLSDDQDPTLSIGGEVSNYTTINFDTVSNATNGILPNGDNVDLKEGDLILIEERGNGLFKGVNSATPNGYNILDFTANFGIYFELDYSKGVYFENCGAVGDGVTDDINPINAALSLRGLVKGMGKTYAIGDTMLLKRGTLLSGYATVDTFSGRGTIIKKLPNTNVPMLQTEAAAGGDPTHYYNIENIVFHGDRDNQTTEVDAVQFWGAWIGSSLDNVFITSHLGQALTFDEGSDVQIGRVWVQAITLTSGYAVNTNESHTGALRSGIFYADGQLYIENISNKVGGDPRNVEDDRGNALRLHRMTSCNLNEVHIEGARRVIDVESMQSLNINKLSGAWLGLDSDTDGSMVRFLDTGSIIVRVGQFNGATGINLDYFAALADGVSNNNLFNTMPIESDPRGGTFTFTNKSDSKEYRMQTRFANTIEAQRIGSSTTARNKLTDNDGVSYSYSRLEGDDTFFGSTFNQTSNAEMDFFGIISNGGLGDRFEIYHPTLLPIRELANNIIEGSVWKTGSTNTAGVGPAYQVETGSTAGQGMMCSFIRGSGSPTLDAKYIGQGYIDLSSSPKGVYISVAFGTGASDWVKLN